jgi:hypothetical protein
MALATATKGTSSITESYTKMKGLADDIASTGKKLDDEDLVTYILTGLGEEFESIITVVANIVEPITVPELYAQLIGHEQRKEIHTGGGHHLSANATTRGDCGGGGYSGGSRGRDGGRGGYHNNGNGGGGVHGHNFQPRIFCQICGKEGHPAFHCRKRFDNNYSGPHRRVPPLPHPVHMA